MLRALGLSSLSTVVVALAMSAPAQAFPEWEKKPPPTWGPVTTQPAEVETTSIKIFVDGKPNHCGLKGFAEVENTGGHGYIRTEGVIGGCTGFTGSHECTPAASLQFFFKNWQAELVGAVFALSTTTTELEVQCSAGTPGPAIGLYSGSLEPEVKPNKLKFIGTGSGTLHLGAHTLDLKGAMKLTPFAPATKLRG